MVSWVLKSWNFKTTDLNIVVIFIKWNLGYLWSSWSIFLWCAKPKFEGFCLRSGQAVEALGSGWSPTSLSSSFHHIYPNLYSFTHEVLLSSDLCLECLPALLLQDSAEVPLGASHTTPRQSLPLTPLLLFRTLFMLLVLHKSHCTMIFLFYLFLTAEISMRQVKPLRWKKYKEILTFKESCTEILHPGA